MPCLRGFAAVSYFPFARLIRKPSIQHAPAHVPRFSVQPSRGTDFGIHARLSFLLMKDNPTDPFSSFAGGWQGDYCFGEPSSVDFVTVSSSLF